MTRLKIIIIVLIAIGILFLFAPVQGHTDDFILDDADESRTVGMEESGILSTLIDLVVPRFVIQSANANLIYEMQALPATLVDLIDAIGSRFVFQHANANRYLSLSAIPTQLEIVLEQITSRVILQSANANRQIGLYYPVALINDTTAPQISDVTATPFGQNQALINWTTDEFADSAVLFGLAPEVYPWTVYDPLYWLDHELTIEVPHPGRVYYRVRSTDLSGNTATSDEYSFDIEGDYYIFLPFTVR